MNDSPADGPKERPSPNLDSELPINQASDERDNFSQPQLKAVPPLKMVETAFLASAASLIWFINYYFPLGPLLRIFFPVPIALVYLRWGQSGSLDGDRSFWVASFGVNGANSQYSIYHSIWSVRGAPGCCVATSVSVGCFHWHGYAAVRFRVLFSAWAAVSFGGSRRLGLSNYPGDGVGGVGISEAGIAGSAQCIHNSGGRDRAGLRQQSNLLICSTSGSLVSARPVRKPDSSTPPLGASSDGLRRVKRFHEGGGRM